MPNPRLQNANYAQSAISKYFTRPQLCRRDPEPILYRLSHIVVERKLEVESLTHASNQDIPYTLATTRYWAMFCKPS